MKYDREEALRAERWLTSQGHHNVAAMLRAAVERVDELELDECERTSERDAAIDKHLQALARIRELEAEVERLRVLVSEVRIYGTSGTKHGDCANVPEDWSARAAEALNE